MCAQLFHATDTCQTLAYVVDGAHLVLRVKAVETAAIEDDGGTKTANNYTSSDRIFCNLMNRSDVAMHATCGSLLLRENHPQSHRQHKFLRTQCFANTLVI